MLQRFFSIGSVQHFFSQVSFAALGGQAFCRTGAWLQTGFFAQIFGSLQMGFATGFSPQAGMGEGRGGTICPQVRALKGSGKFGL